MRYLDITTEQEIAALLWISTFCHIHGSSRVWHAKGADYILLLFQSAQIAYGRKWILFRIPFWPDIFMAFFRGDPAALSAWRAVWGWNNQTADEKPPEHPKQPGCSGGFFSFRQKEVTNYETKYSGAVVVRHDLVTSIFLHFVVFDEQIGDVLRGGQAGLLSGLINKLQTYHLNGELPVYRTRKGHFPESDHSKGELDLYWITLSMIAAGKNKISTFL